MTASDLRLPELLFGAIVLVGALVVWLRVRAAAARTAAFEMLAMQNGLAFVPTGEVPEHVHDLLQSFPLFGPLCCGGVPRNLATGRYGNGDVCVYEAARGALTVVLRSEGLRLPVCALVRSSAAMRFVVKTFGGVNGADDSLPLVPLEGEQRYLLLSQDAPEAVQVLDAQVRGLIAQAEIGRLQPMLLGVGDLLVLQFSGGRIPTVEIQTVVPRALELLISVCMRIRKNGERKASSL